MMLGDDFGRSFEEIYAADYLRAVFYVPPHMVPFVFGKRAALEQDAVGNAYLSDIVKQRAVLKRNQLAVVQPDLLAQPQTVRNHTLRVAFCFDVPRFKRGSKRAQRRAIVQI